MTKEVRSDIFGNQIDPEVGYARGGILRSSLDEARRYKHCQAITVERVREHGVSSIAVFTGSLRAFPIAHEDQDTICAEWLGPGLHAEEIKSAALGHLGGRPDHGIAFFNRTSAGIIAAVNSLACGNPVVSVVPANGKSHASVVRGCALTGVPLIEVQENLNWREAITHHRPKLILITTVTSSLDILDDATTEQVIDFGHEMGARIMLDEAYGTRLRPALMGGRPSLAFDADLAITNCDKSGMQGPRAGLMGGVPELIDRVQSRAFELGMEARPPLIAAAFRALQHYRPEQLVEEARKNAALTTALRTALPSIAVQHTALGPLLSEESVLSEMMRIGGLRSGKPPIVPCEATTALGVFMLRDHGILTTNTHGQPGASVTLRLKPTSGALERVGGVEGVVAAVCRSMEAAADAMREPAAFHELFFGEPSQVSALRFQ